MWEANRLKHLQLVRNGSAPWLDLRLEHSRDWQKQDFLPWERASDLEGPYYLRWLLWATGLWWPLSGATCLLLSLGGKGGQDKSCAGVWMWNLPTHWLFVFGTWSPDVLELRGSLRRWGLAGGTSPFKLALRFDCAVPPPARCLLPDCGCNMGQLPHVPASVPFPTMMGSNSSNCEPKWTLPRLRCFLSSIWPQ